MTHINIDLRLNNLTAFTQALQHFFASFNLADKKAAHSSNAVNAVNANAKNISTDFYAKASHENPSIVNIDRQLTAQGNAW